MPGPAFCVDRGAPAMSNRKTCVVCGKPFSPKQEGQISCGFKCADHRRDVQQREYYLRKYKGAAHRKREAIRQIIAAIAAAGRGPGGKGG